MTVLQISARCFTLILSASTAMLLGGCGKQPDRFHRAAVSGIVAIDGTPLETGTILFVPADGKGTAAGGEIHEGRFHLDQLSGPVVGLNRVEIRSVQKTGRTVVSPVIPEYDGPADADLKVEEYRDLVPPKYNSQSTLQEEIKADIDNELTFDLTSVAK